MTLNDLERHNGRYFALFRGIRPLQRTHPWKILATPMMQVPTTRIFPCSRFFICFSLYRVYRSYCSLCCTLLTHMYEGMRLQIKMSDNARSSDSVRASRPMIATVVFRWVDVVMVLWTLTLVSSVMTATSTTTTTASTVSNSIAVQASLTQLSTELREPRQILFPYVAMS